jgi:Heterokaryon incompatibility protein (HET)
MDVSTDSLIYPKLGSEAGEFRLLDLEPSTSFDGEIRCYVFNASLENCPEYEALSYRWGDSKETRTIYVRLTRDREVKLQQAGRLRQIFQTREQRKQSEDHNLFVQMQVTVNLEQALRGLRLRDASRTIWIDALCIDQRSLSERARQVRIMGQIYSKCIRDLLWLGPEDPQIGRAMDLIQRFQGRIKQNSQDEIEETTFSKLTEQEWADVEKMVFENEVWNRVWIVQEVMLSPQILICCGKRSMDWECISAVLEDNLEYNQSADTLGPLSSKILKVLARVSTIRIFRMPQEITQRILGRSLLSVVLFFLEWKATDKRDRIYAVLGITPEGRHVEVDYTKTNELVSIDFAKACLQEGSLMILSTSTAYQVELNQYLRKHPDGTAEKTDTSPRTKTTGTSHTLPTWVPDVMSMVIYNAKTTGLSMSGLCRYNACGIRSTSTFSISPSLHLTVEGMSVGVVSLVNSISLVSENEEPRDRWVRDVLRWVPPGASTKKLYPWTARNGETSINAYWRTVVTDRRLDKRLSNDDLEYNANTYLDIHEGRVVPDELLALAGWRFGMSSRRMYCMLPPHAQVRDVITLLYGAKVPLLLRPTPENRDLFELVGEVYVHGIMDGEATAYAFFKDMFSQRSFTIV